MSFFECREIKRRFGNFLLDISFSVDRGDFYCITGKSGSGKSTLLSVIAGLIPPAKSDSGRIFLGEREITDLPPGKREIGMVFQQPSLFLNMSVLDNVAYGLVCRGMKKKDARIQAEEFLEPFGLSHLLHESAETVSGGEAQRIALARTLIVRPKLILLDEPMSALDAPLRKKMGEEILSVKEKFDFTALMVTHDIDEAKRLSTKVMVMGDGKKKWEGLPQDFDESRI